MRVLLSSCGVGVNVEAPESFLTQILKNDFIKKGFPSLSLHKPDFSSPIIRVNFSDKFSLSENYPLFEYSGNNALDVLFMAQHVLERRRQEKNMYCINSSCAEFQGKAVILFGWKDTGKTSVAINLSRKKGFEFVSESMTVMNPKKEIVGRIHFLEEDNDFLKKKYGFEEDCLSIEKICEVSSSPCSVKMFVYPQLASENKLLNWTDTDKARFHLYEQFSMEIRSVFKNIHDYSRPLMPLDTVELSLKRAEFTKLLAHETVILQIRGDLDFICDKIEENL